MKRQFLLLAALIPLACVTQASTVIQSFNDIGDVYLTNNLPLRDLDVPGGVGFSSGFEQTGSGVAVIRTNDLVVSLANYVSGQDATAQHWAMMTVTNSSGIARRTQTRSTPSMSGTIWFSFLASLRNPNGDVALVFNGGFTVGGSGTPTVGAAGMRVGLGNYGTASLRGALGVGPVAVVNNQEGLTNIIIGGNGVVTAAGFVPTNGTAVLILGRIDSDPGSGYPRVSLWYNPDVPNEASLPAPTLTFSDASYNIVPMTVTRIGFQNVRHSAVGVYNEMLDNVKVSDEPNAFDIVYKNAPLPIPILNVVGTAPAGSETGPTNLVFTISTDKPVATPLTVNYTLTGVATNGYDGAGGFAGADYTDTNFNTGTLTSSATIPQGKTNVSVVVQVIDDTVPEGNESVIFTLQAAPSSYILGNSASVTGAIFDNNDAQVSVQYMFTRTLAAQVWDTNLSAAPAVVTGIGNGTYSGAYWVSADAAYSAGGDHTASDEATAVANGDYMGLAIAPIPGRTLTMTNLQFLAVYGNYLYQVPEAAQAVISVRSSLDNFTTNLAQFTLQPDNLVFPNIWYTNAIALGPEFSQVPGQLGFRLYIYDDSNHNQVGVRIDNLYFSGVTAALPAGVNQVSVSTNVVNAAEPSTAGQFTLTRIGDASNPLTVNYTVSGTASNGADYVFLPGTAAFAAGDSNAVVTVTPLDDQLPESTETVVLSLAAGTGYGLLFPSTASLTLRDDGDLGIGAVAVYFFNENANGVAATISAVAAATIQQTNSLAALNAAAGPGIGNFGQSGGAGIGHGYANQQWYSSPSSFYFRGDYWGTNADQALAGGDYLSLTVGAVPGRAVTLTNFSARLKLQPTSGQTSWVFLRSSADNFATDLGSLTVPGTDTNADPWWLWNVPLALTNVAGAVEFRLYTYGSRANLADILRLDDATFYGDVGALPAGTQVVTLVASDPTAAEPGTDTGAFTLQRYGDTSAPLAVNYAIGGTASNGVDYVALNGTANFAAGQTSLLLTVTPLDDIRPEPTETVTLSLFSSLNYVPGFYSTATVNLADDGDNTPLFTFATSDTNAFERVPGLTGSFTLNRVLGDMTTPVIIGFTLGGSAALGVDYVATASNSVTFANGVTTQTIQIVPLDNSLADGDRTVTLTVQAPPSTIVDPPLSGTVTIVDDEVASETVLWSDNFDAGTSAANYTLRSASELGVDDYVADFAFDYSTLGLPPAPGSTNSVGLLMNANDLGGPATVNFYPIGQTFSGDFALRFSLFVSMDPFAASDNEAAFFGINQSGLATNWTTSYGVGNAYTNYGEGIWATVATRDGTPGIATLRAATALDTAPMLVGSTGNFPDLFNSPPYGQAGRPNNAYDSTNKTWVDCELNQVGGVVSLKLNHTVVLQYTNTTPFTSGNVFIGYGDPFGTIGSANCLAVFDNVRVVKLAAPIVPPRITSFRVLGDSVEVLFTAGTSDQAAGFRLQSSSQAAGGYGDDGSAAIAALGNGQFKATTSASGSARFYRIQR